MAREKGNNYFSLLEELAAFSCQAAEELERVMASYCVAHLEEDLTLLHAIEHTADVQKHILVDKLIKEFITPIEREDIMAITDRIDDVTDAVEDVLQKLYMFNIRHIREDALTFVGLLRQCCTGMVHVLRNFENFKRPKALTESIIELNRLEEQGDALYIAAVHALYLSPASAESTVWTEIYNSMEAVCDSCENVADLVEHVVMKNS